MSIFEYIKNNTTYLITLIVTLAVIIFFSILLNVIINRKKDIFNKNKNNIKESEKKSE